MVIKYDYNSSMFHSDVVIVGISATIPCASYAMLPSGHIVVLMVYFTQHEENRHHQRKRNGFHVVTREETTQRGCKCNIAPLGGLSAVGNRS